jgi:UDP-glucuronate 4-epimerase
VISGITLVTGATGLIGRHVLAKLKAQGRTAIGIDIATKPDHPEVLAADLTDIHRLHAIVLERRVDAIVHCGAVSGPMVMIDNPYGIVQANVVGTANVLELARVHKMRRVVFCSSTSAYGPTVPPVDEAVGLPEETALRPSSVYGSTKVAGEQLLAAYRQQHGLDAVAIRLSWVYGPGRTTECVIRTIIENAIADRPTKMPWGGNFPRQFIHVSDAVDALMAALDADACPTSVYTATGGTFLSLGDIAGLTAGLLDRSDVELADGPDPLDDYQHRFDISAIARDLGFKPKLSLEEGIGGYIGWLKAREQL